MEAMNLKAVRAKRDYCRISNNRTDCIRATGDDEVFVKGVAFAADGTGDFMKVEIVDRRPLPVRPMEKMADSLLKELEQPVSSTTKHLLVDRFDLVSD